jgi:hypothetical protein
MALKDLRARQILLIVAGSVMTGCFLRGIMSVREGKFGLAALMFVVSLLLSCVFKEKIAILYIGLIFLAVGFSMSAPFDRSGRSVVASIVLWASLVSLAKWDNKRRVLRTVPRLRN